ncbi:MAG TPA: glycosyltransferase family 39 protein, partial [Anaerolineae bacterium]
MYSIVTPIFEAGDELWHYPFVQSLARGNSLPVQDPNVKTLWEQEGGQPPLYYAVAAVTTFWIDTSDLTDRLWRNPEAKIGIPLDFGNKNMVVHTSAEEFPWHNTALAVHLIRFLSILFSTFTVLFTYLLSLEIKTDRTLASVAAALVAFNPMFLFISASVNNDNLAVMLAALVLLLCARLITREPTTRRFSVLGFVLGLAALSKVSDLGLLVVAAGVFAYRMWKQWDADRRGPPQIISSSPRSSVLVRILVSSVLCAALVVAIAGWWYARNWLLYGDPLAFNVWVAIAGGRPIPATLTSLLGEFQGFRISFWGNFGGVNIIAPDWVYTILDAFTAIAAIGLFIGLARRTLPRMTVLPVAWLVLILIALVRWTWLTFASQGRLIFPAIGAVAILMAYGLAQFRIFEFRIPLGRFISRVLLLAIVTCLFAFSALTPFALIAPTYALADRLPSNASVPNPTLIVFDDQAELVGYALPQKSVAPGSELALTVYWRARSSITEDFSVYIRLFDAMGNIVGRWEAFPGEGLYPTRLWQPGEVVVDRYLVPVAAGAPGVGRIEVGMFRRAPLENLTARDPRGNVITPTIARFKLGG